MERPKGASLSSTILNLSNSIIGAGTLTIPFSMVVAGWAGGLACIFVACACSAASFVLLYKASILTGLYSYKEIALRAFGPRGGQISLAVVSIYTFGSTTGYCVLLGDFWTGAMRSWLPADNKYTEFFLNRWNVTPMFAVAILLPVSMCQNLDPLKYTSVIALLSIFYAVTMVTVHCATADELATGLKPLNTSSEFFRAFPLLVVAFCGHYNCLRLYEELGPSRSSKKMNIVIGASILICTVFYLTCGFSGYLQFGDKLQGNILNAYPTERAFDVLLARFLFFFAIAFSYPLLHHALRQNLHFLLFPGQRETIWRLRALTIPVMAGNVLLSVAVPDVSIVLGYNGSTLGVLLVYVLPALFYLKLTSDRRERENDHNYSELKEVAEDGEMELQPKDPSEGTLRVVSVLLIIIGTVFGVAGVYSVAVNG